MSCRQNNPEKLSTLETENRILRTAKYKIRKTLAKILMRFHLGKIIKVVLILCSGLIGEKKLIKSIWEYSTQLACVIIFSLKLRNSK